jgi:hypothetical protein
MSSGYVDPIPKGVTPTRIDQGVDYRGAGTVLALGDATVVSVRTGVTGWPGLGTANSGPWVAYKLTSGPDSGKTVYVAEDIHPSVTVGQKVKAGQPIAAMVNQGTGIETGWANAAGTGPLSQDPSAGGISGANLPAGGTLVGRSFEALLVGLGAPKANNYSSTATGGKLPSGYTATGVGGGSPAPVPAGGGGGLLSIPSEITGFFSDANKFVTLLMWIAQPSSWLRIGAFLVGIGLLLFAIHALIAAANGTPLVKMPSVVPVPV